MSDEVLQRTISEYMATGQSVYSMVWHGGEPTLQPVSFYEKVIDFQKSHAPRGARISNSLQTNGIAITGDLAALLGRYRFLCGVSMDGPAEIHDRYRLTRRGEPTHELVREGLRTLHANSVATDTLVLVNSANVDDPAGTYRYLRDTGAEHLHFIPCVEWDGEGRLRPEAISDGQWGRFMSRVFHEWYANDIGRVSIRLFESVLAKIVQGVSIDCYNSGSCDRYLLVEANGDVYPCDFFTDRYHLLGNIMDMSFEEIRNSRKYRDFAALKTAWAKECDDCEFVELCMGDCRKYRLGGTGRSFLCEGWKEFYSRTLPHFSRLAGRVKG